MEYRFARLGDLGSAFGAERRSVAIWRLIGDLFSRIRRFWRLIGHLFSRMWRFWRVFRTDLATKWSCWYLPAPVTFFFFFFLDRQTFFDADGGDFWRLGPIVKLATFGDFPDLFRRFAAPNTWHTCWNRLASAVRRPFKHHTRGPFDDNG